MNPSIMTAFLLFDPTAFEPFQVLIRHADGSVVNTGRPFRTYERACAFVEGLDVAARLFGARAIDAVAEVAS